ncbi:flavin reductase (DIM6/NTAB) family NADH-FMN oxidoreductase RutF [Pontibacter ummariensis]|uniref:NADH-FMN oxidoreductase RutF, flavin reductase (DIM6/NTAB) family n=1 Tax=Pontibacter ummariensis TaxID=1610492 RepID=A0A239L8X0_9BACT|nr:flavin reductase family protein [Pontibacter ummariensis]PRY03983.1 flavin reductase (DIM6/NTAB) family NADH-FMN oxidoreductase RutF [Pontibacter ummariensis]SNT26432.1 NADH-FMN oxidoreductase RutF, flavin reductase (DIM6/NTAB) family [Pontibacter ummariensis]
MSIRTIDPRAVQASELYGLMSGAVVPRPIAFASTADAAGRVNLSPFSFFNLFSAKPPILVFSPLSRMRDNTSKHTLDNILATREVVINIPTYAIVEQMSLASTEYAQGVDEFVKSGLTPVPSELVSPPRVQEAPVAFECRVQDVVRLGEEGGAGNLVLCEVVLMHVKETVLDEQGKIDPQQLDAVARLGGDYYLRASGDSIFQLPKPTRTKGMGVDQLPDFIRNSEVLTGNNLARLGNTPAFPMAEEVAAFKYDPLVSYTLNKYKSEPDRLRKELELLGKKLLEDNRVEEAWKVLLLNAPS